MPAYASPQELNDRFGEGLIRQLADRDHSGAADTALLQKVLDAASGEVDLALAGRYTTPLDVGNVPVAIVEITLILAFRKLFGAGTLPEDTQNLAKEAQGMLKAISEGKYTLKGVSRSGGEKNTLSGRAFIVSTQESELGDGNLGSFGQ